LNFHHVVFLSRKKRIGKLVGFHVFTHNLCDEQGDQMSFVKNRPKRGPIYFLTKLIRTFYVPWKKVAQNGWLLLYFSTAKENNILLGENSPNLVTLVTR
jgi:hypothetical protein